MSRNPLDEHIKKNLESREITPSENSWHSLKDKLEADEVSVQTSSFKKFYWVAAAIVIMLLAGGTYIFSEGFNKDEPQIVAKEAKSESSKNQLEENALQNEIEEPVVASESKPIKKTLESREEPKDTKEAILMPEESLVVTEKKEEETDYETEKINEVASKIVTLQESNSVTDEEIEALLLEAQKSIYKERMALQSPDSLSALALLEEVETELDQSFKEKVFEAIKESFVKVRTAVAERKE
ncbi:hypothetical protein [Galbibacter mesophilus]|uniref:hypothetical protein n=1 Tax=Galbibacter mesophilus TaxID=379069 RepID=UPI00191FC1F5|nr:hypothetical protein [Galbibacter mesophilus]MCM5661491.1 hypothetical protein [Galbibacter mesophilus]